MKSVFVLAMLLVFSSAFSAPTAPAQLLAQAKTASGGNNWNKVRSLIFKGTLEAGSLSGTFTSIDDLRTGRSAFRYTLGPVSGAQGFDGLTSWTQSPDGEISADSSRVAKKAAKSEAYQSANGWWHPKRWPAKIKSLGTRTQAGVTYDVLRLTPRGGTPFQLWINARTHLMARLVIPLGDYQKRTYYVSDYRNVDGIKVPFKQFSSDGDKLYDETRHVLIVTVNAPVTAKDFAVPAQRTNSF